MLQFTVIMNKTVRYNYIGRYFSDTLLTVVILSIKKRKQKTKKKKAKFELIRMRHKHTAWACK